MPGRHAHLCIDESLGTRSTIAAVHRVRRVNTGWLLIRTVLVGGRGPGESASFAGRMPGGPAAESGALELLQIPPRLARPFRTRCLRHRRSSSARRSAARLLAEARVSG